MEVRVIGASFASEWTGSPRFYVTRFKSSTRAINPNRIRVLSDKKVIDFCSVLLDTRKTRVLHLRVFSMIANSAHL